MSDLTDFITGLFLFRGMDAEKVSWLLDKSPPELFEYKRGEVIYSPDGFEQRMGFIVSGRCEVRRIKADGTPVSINTLNPGGCFGALAVFSEDEFPTEVVALKTASVLFFDKETVERLVRDEPTVAMNVIRFLAGRVSFLNGKISTFSGTRVEQRLASYILQLYRDTGICELPFNCKKASEAINSGRASVYRALDLLCDEGFIIYESKKIILNDPEGLERIIK